MNDRQRHRARGVPHGSVPNWVLWVFGACVVVLALVAGPLV
jgi:hypothetical protein